MQVFLQLMKLHSLTSMVKVAEWKNAPLLSPLEKRTSAYISLLRGHYFVTGHSLTHIHVHILTRAERFEYIECVRYVYALIYSLC